MPIKKHMFMKKNILFILLIVITYSVAAQVKFTAASEKAVQTGETFRLIYTVNAKASGFEKPAISNFDILSGPNRSTSQSFEYINGKSSQSYTFSYTYYLRAKNVGTFTIPPAKVTVEGQKYKSNSLKIKVIKGQVANNSNSETTNSSDPNDLFLTVYISKNKVNKGEHVTATVKLYSLIDLVDIEDIQFPKYPGFLIKNIFTPDRISLKRETYDGKIYNTATLRKDLLFPQKSGNLTIKPAKIDLVVRQKTGKVRNFFGQWVNRYENIRRTVKSAPISVRVSPLPGNQPDNFSGLVGRNFSIKTEIDNKNPETNEGTNLKFSVKGKGNIHLFNQLNINIPKGIETFPENSENITYDEQGASGTKYFDYLLVPEAPGKFRIPPVNISYFNTKTKSYQTISSDEIILDVTKSANYRESNAGNYSSKISEKLSSDIRYIKRNPKQLTNGNKYFAGSKLFYFLIILSIIAFTAIIIYKRKQIKSLSNISELKNKRAGKISKKQLKTAKKLMAENEKEHLFYKEISTAVWEYITNKFNIEKSSLTKNHLKEVFEQRQLNSELLQELINILNQAEYAQYGGNTSATEKKRVFSDTKKIIDKIEQNVI